MTRIVLIFCWILFGFTGKGQAQKAPEFLQELKSRDDFDQMKGAPLSGGFQGIECIKLVYVVSTKRLYYVNSKRYKWHYQFTSEILHDYTELYDFNEWNYSESPYRQYILATFNYNTSTKNYFLQFSAADKISDELIDVLVQKVNASFFKKDKYKLLLNTTTLLRRKKELAQKHETITSDEIFRNQQYQPIYKGRAMGILKFVKADSLKTTFNYANCILLMEGSSNELPLCRGVVTSEFQTPLSHICLLTNNRKTPSAASKKIEESLHAYEGKLVELRVMEESFSIRLLSDTIALTEKKKPRKALKADTLTRVIADLSALSYGQRKTYGTKACNLAEIRKLQFQKTTVQTPPAAFAIPFAYYREHLKRYGIDRRIHDLMSDPEVLASDSLLDKKLAKIRKLIRQSALDTVFLEKIERLCENRYGQRKVRFRSSSNCEDEAGFNGAGLYTSESGRLGDTAKSIERAIKKVWASLWSLRAFRERSYYNFDQETVCMGILVHETFDDELVNGVAITRNLYRPGYEAGFVINLQKGEEEVVSPKPGQTCEQLISYMNMNVAFYESKRSADWLSFSSLNNGQPLLSEEELLELTRQLEAVKHHFYRLYNSSLEYPDFAMDVEFKLIRGADQKRHFIIKQARPYSVR